MYHVVLLHKDQRDLHQFVWRADPHHAFTNFRRTKLTFVVSASSFADNMAMKQNALNHKKEYPKAFKAVVESFYVDDSLTGADSVEEAIELHEQLQKLFVLGGIHTPEMEIK